jgi:hypothetical protein
MAITADARTPGSQAFAAGASIAGGTSVTWTHTLGVLSAGILIVTGAQDAAAASTSAVWDQGGTNVAMTRKTNATATGSCRPEIWFLKAPSPTGAKSARVSWSGSHDGGFGSASYDGVDQTTIFNAASPQNATGASGTNPSLTVTTAAGEMAIDAVVQDFSANSVAPNKGASQTYICAGAVSAPSIGAGGSDRAAVGASTAMSWTVDTTKGAWSQTGVSLLPAAGAASPFPPFPTVQQTYAAMFSAG